ncbi:hypothetical protein FNV43_RR23136 [Rhamnella rubrinervis]|uniref:F-box domain-containing protein n=1 Tax=Rhamnella rubrinervis TaxID=2594499 RepID=A0A8K0GRS5_9ROSA|nr:hypothetical protein FNV43_RR23136 [Rhamnella rubrinervis]
MGKLPEDILIWILCKLSVEEAARTGVVSRRWNKLWKKPLLFRQEVKKLVLDFCVRIEGLDKVPSYGGFLASFGGVKSVPLSVSDCFHELLVQFSQVKKRLSIKVFAEVFLVNTKYNVIPHPELSYVEHLKITINFPWPWYIAAKSSRYHGLLWSSFLLKAAPSLHKLSIKLFHKEHKLTYRDIDIDNMGVQDLIVQEAMSRVSEESALYRNLMVKIEEFVRLSERDDEFLINSTTKLERHPNLGLRERERPLVDDVGDLLSTRVKSIDALERSLVSSTRGRSRSLKSRSESLSLISGMFHYLSFLSLRFERYPVLCCKSLLREMNWNLTWNAISAYSVADAGAKFTLNA